MKVLQTTLKSTFMRLKKKQKARQEKSRGATRGVVKQGRRPRCFPHMGRVPTSLLKSMQRAAKITYSQ